MADTAVAPAAPAATTPAAAPATTQTPTAAPAKPAGGFLDHIKIPERSPAESQQPTVTPPAAAPAPGQTPGTPTPKPGETPAPVVFKATVRGREYTGEELAKAYDYSSTEGIRLDQAVKQARQELIAERAKYAELQEKFDAVPPFPILTKEQLKEMDPADQTEYVIKKNAWETQKESRKEAIIKAQSAHKAEAEEVKTYIYSRSEHMMTSAEFPGYKDLMPVMEQILDRMPNLAGRRETPDLLYYTALGLQKYRESKVSKESEEKAKADAAAKAAADAAAAGGGNPPAPVGAGAPVDDDSDEAFNKRILGKAQKSIFK